MVLYGLGVIGKDGKMGGGKINLVSSVTLRNIALQIVTMGVFDKNVVCEYCKKEMVASYRSKRFCSDKCRVYFRRGNVKSNVSKTKQPVVTNSKKIVKDAPVQKELTKAEMFKLMREGKI